MKSYKVEIEETRTYTFDVAAETENVARIIASSLYDDALDAGTLHHAETGDPRVDVSNVFDVTGTDDAPAPEEN